MSTLQVTRYHPLLVALHWVLAILIIADLAIGTQILVHIPNDVAKKIEGLRAHTGAGIVILALMLVRLAVRLRTAAPVGATAGNAFLDRLAWVSHRALYVVIFGMIISGLVMGAQAHIPDVVIFGRGRLPDSFWTYPARGVHYFFSRLLIALIALHFAGALYHTFLRRDRLLRRMWFGRRFQDREVEAASAAARGGGFWVHAPWIERAILAAPTALFILIGSIYMGTPHQVAAGSQIELGSPAAVTDVRAVGAIFLSLGIATLWSLFSTRRLFAGLALAAIVVGCVTVARVLGILVDGVASESVFKLVPEVVLISLLALGIGIERGRHRHLGEAPSQAGVDALRRLEESRAGGG